ncbi:MAG: hypothetical protein MZV64_37065 [Ignavibacteriales bacterium]|nr:hypothetical protein [Ignavibacteriales bacterium]
MTTPPATPIVAGPFATDPCSCPFPCLRLQVLRHSLLPQRHLGSRWDRRSCACQGADPHFGHRADAAQPRGRSRFPAHAGSRNPLLGLGDRRKPRWSRPFNASPQVVRAPGAYLPEASGNNQDRNNESQGEALALQGFRTRDRLR